MSTLTIPAVASAWKTDPVHSRDEFKVKHGMTSKVRGHSKNLAGTLLLDGTDASRSKIDASVEVSSIDTHDPQRDRHKSADFFDAEKFPTLWFQSSRITDRGNGEPSVTGDRTIHGVNRSFTFGVVGPRCSHKRSLGRYARWGVGDDEDQPKGLRPDRERDA
jgi:polyisoprenoid-binding protein YceI